MMIIKILALAITIGSCATTPVTNNHWQACEKICGDYAVREACVTPIKGPACTCYDDFTFWIDTNDLELDADLD